MEGKGTSLRKAIPNKAWKRNPVEAIHLPKEVAVIHCWGHEKVLTPMSQRKLCGEKDKNGALSPTDVSPVSALGLFPPQEPVSPKHTPS
jgi:hypothetical protein